MAVTTTRYHPEVLPPPPGSKFPPTFYEPILFGRVPLDITSSIVLEPYGKSNDWVKIETYTFSVGQTLDILYEANKPVIWQGQTPDTVLADVRFGVNNVGGDQTGLAPFWGFFYEGAETSEGMYSTALRIIAWADGKLELSFRNYSPQTVKVSYSIWKSKIVPDFENDYLIKQEKYWESTGVSEGEFVKMKLAMERYLAEKRQVPFQP